MTDDDGVALVRQARAALVRQARRERVGRAIAVGGALAMSALALVISAWGAQWQADQIVSDARAQRAEVASAEIGDANARLDALGLPRVVPPPDAPADVLFLLALRGQAAADRAQERQALGQPIDPGPDPLVPPPDLTGPTAPTTGTVPDPTTGAPGPTRDAPPTPRPRPTSPRPRRRAPSKRPRRPTRHP